MCYNKLASCPRCGRVTVATTSSMCKECLNTTTQYVRESGSTTPVAKNPMKLDIPERSTREWLSQYMEEFNAHPTQKGIIRIPKIILLVLVQEGYVIVTDAVRLTYTFTKKWDTAYSKAFKLDNSEPKIKESPGKPTLIFIDDVFTKEV